METLIEKTKDIDVQIVFNNAGYCIINVSTLMQGKWLLESGCCKPTSIQYVECASNRVVFATELLQELARKTTLQYGVQHD
jgi:hypothetical protein